MAEETVEIVLSHPWVDDEGSDHEIGDRFAVPIATAKKLVRGGVAVYPTKSDAVEAEGEAGVDKTARAVRKRASGSE